MTVAPTSPPTAPRDDAEVELLLRFVHERDVSCPRCGYNLRNLLTPVCPECREALLLKVGVQRVRLAAWLLTLVPGFFCTCALGIFVVMCLLHGPPGGADTMLWLIIGFFVISTVVCIGLALSNLWFTRLGPAAQWTWAAAIWIAHLTVFGLVATAV